ncbi:hypothetical protein XM38_012440 [Halomicronema hongdechloris C2206]|uniref:Actin-like protein N-terminal domain-containing protein n=1 Tax=Halomicronema hongdechloris C2206 TaxID=1641165 RepID=A0A1Z3HJM9_9CYAN|nr:hypothetical protein [Halomicronema hongdechloris]ASC70307.1 hypothetical protein XM38_012440 [Halomicronema hongdechloris C2206]
MLTATSDPQLSPPSVLPKAADTAPIGADANKVAIAVGAGFAKVFDGGQFYRLRSLVAPQIPLTGAGSATQLRVKITNSPYAGEFAAGENLESATTLESLAHGLKPKWYGPLALAMLAQIAPDDVELFTVTLTASVPTPQMAGELKPLVGLHDVAVNAGRRITINVTGVKPVPESLGTAVAIATDRPVAVLDLGYQNSTISGFDPSSRAMIDSLSLNGGVAELFESIATLANTTGTRPSPEAIRLGVEARTFELWGHSGDSFRDAYLQCFEPWLKGRIHAAKVEGAHIFQKCPVKVIAGGGALLPGVASVAHQLGVALCQEPQEMELKGIYRL